MILLFKICDLCDAFGENGKYLRCPYCTRRGGAMRPSNIAIRNNNLITKELNPDFHKYS